MKKILTIVILGVMAGMLIYACKKQGENNSLLNPGFDRKQSGINSIQNTCPPTVITGTITSPLHLTAPNSYLLRGNVVISNTTLTIDPGVVIFGETSTRGALIVLSNATIDAQGTSTNPIVFTSDQAAGSRTAGAWKGVRILGQAPNNNSNAFPIDLGSGTYTGGGSNNSHNSGFFQHVQIHYAGYKDASDNYPTALMFNSVGTGTTVNNIQLSNNLNDAFKIYGGSVALKQVVSYNADVSDYAVSVGYQGNMQYIAALRLNNSAVPTGAAAFALDITQSPLTPTSTRLTTPVISNFTALGPNYCDATTVSNKFTFAIRLSDGTGGKIYNSVVSRWNTTATPSGLLIVDPATVAQTASGNIEFSHNSFHNSGTTPYLTSVASWSVAGGCDASMADWITGSGSATCIEDGNQFSVSTLGYNSSFCSNFCSSFTSNFTIGSTSLLSSDFSWDSGSVFAHPSYRGAFGSTDFTSGWTDWCPQNTNYCV